MITFYPMQIPTQVIAFIEGDREELESGKLNPGAQRVSMSGEKVEATVLGTHSCDGIRTAP